MDFDPPAGIRALGPGPRASVLDFELSEPLSFRATGEDAKAYDTAEIATFGETLVRIRRPGRDDFRRQLAYVRRYADLRPDRLPEIHSQIGDILSFFGALDYLDHSRTKWVLELLVAGIRLAIAVEMRIKHALNCPRPVAFSSAIQPIIQTPTHGALPSGHATESFLVATLLTLLEADAAERAGATFTVAGRAKAAIAHFAPRYRLATRIAVNRTVAGVHYPVDSAAGAVLGVTLGEYVAARATGGGKTPVRVFHGPAYVKDDDEGEDFHLAVLAALFETGGTDRAEAVLDLSWPEANVPAAPHLAEIWSAARGEVTALWGLAGEGLSRE